MDTQQLLAFVTAFACSAFVLTVLSAMRSRTIRGWLGALFTLVCLFVSIVVASIAVPGRNFVFQLVLNCTRLDRRLIISSAAGALAGTLSALALASPGTTKVRFLLACALHGGVLLLIAGIPIKDAFNASSGAQGYASVPVDVSEHSLPAGFRVVEVCKLSIAPACLALGPSERLYVAGYGGMAYQNGVIVRIDPGASGAGEEQRVAAYLNRPHGLAFLGSDLYVAHAGQYNRASKGRIVQENTGAVTCLKDLDGDGKYDYYNDVLTGLPGAQLPDGMHQNNGIAFDGEGYLYVTVGAPSDRGPVVHPYAGSIVRLRPDGSDIRVFARGFRNPYDLAIGPDGQLFCTDNDADSTNLGDALCHVVFGDQFGHPYNALGDGIVVGGVKKPMLRSESALEGIAYARPGTLPPGYDNCLYVASFGDGYIKRVRLQREENTYKASMDNFAAISGVLDTAVGGTGAIYACSYEQRRVYSIRRE